MIFGSRVSLGCVNGKLGVDGGMMIDANRDVSKVSLVRNGREGKGRVSLLCITINVSKIIIALSVGSTD